MSTVRPGPPSPALRRMRRIPQRPRPPGPPLHRLRPGPPPVSGSRPAEGLQERLAVNLLAHACGGEPGKRDVAGRWPVGRSRSPAVELAAAFPLVGSFPPGFDEEGPSTGWVPEVVQL